MCYLRGMNARSCKTVNDPGYIVFFLYRHGAREKFAQNMTSKVQSKKA